MKVSMYIAMAMALVLAGGVSADRVIFAPTGTVLGPGDIRLEGAVGTSNGDPKIYWAGIGLQRLEISGIRFESGASVLGASDDDVLGVELAILPETTLTPGIGVGIWDATDNTSEGRGYYLAVTKAVPLTKQLPLPIRDIRLHVGYGINGVDGIFAGADASIPFGLRLYAEFFQDDFNYALGLGLLPGLQVKVHVLDGDTYYGLQFRPPVRL